MRADFLNPRPKAGLWRRTPPAIFPPLLGLLGLGLGWRRGGAFFGLERGFSDLILGAVTMIVLFCLLTYAAKMLRRPAVMLEDLHILPGRAGLAAMTDSLFLLAAVALPYSAAMARDLLVIALVMHGALAALVIRVLLTGPKEQRRITPVWHLTFVGFILADLSAQPLGATAFSAAILYATIAVAVLIWAASAIQFAHASTPAPLRPLLAIHLAPASLFATVAAGAGLPELALGFGALAAAMALVLLASARWITAAGFTPLWGAFTFPIAAFASACFALSGQGDYWRYLGMAVLAGATLVIPVIAYRILRLWAQGTLAAKTNTAEA